MRISNIAFFAMLFFCLGAASFAWAETARGAALIDIGVMAIIVVAAIIFPARQKFLLPMLYISVFLIIGSLYAGWFSLRSIREFTVPPGVQSSFSGVVTADPQTSGNRQAIEVTLAPPHQGKILAWANTYPAIRYGDSVTLRGAVTAPEPESYALYLAKQGIYGVMNYPTIEVGEHGKGNAFFGKLFSIKQSFEEKLARILPSKEGAFAVGMLLGDRGQFSDDFKDAMKVSGTTHLVALSGYNISIIAISISSLLLALGLHRRVTFWISVTVIGAFVMMTGAESSAVRAAIMGAILMFAGYIGRQQNIRQAIMIAATLMVLVNPRVIRADVGFQLSFLALLGIVYCAPAIERILFPPPIGNKKKDRSFLGWRENLCATLGAQIMALPVLAYHFHQLSTVSVVSNILILEVVPLAMSLAFFAGLLGYVSHIASVIAGWIAYIPLAYQTRIIEFFGGFTTTLAVDSMPIWVFALYYGAIAFGLYRIQRLPVNTTPP